jgi:hypothetical protein
MKKILIGGLVLASAVASFGQGQVLFNNRVVNTPSLPGPNANVYAPVYDVEPGNPTLSQTGQSSIGDPMGATAYGGARLSGTGFTAQLWGGPGGIVDPAQLMLCTAGAGNASTTFRTGANTVGSIVALADAASIPNAPAGGGSRASLQLRAWNNMGGAVTSWAMVMADPANIPHGSSPIFTPPFDLGGGSVTPPNLIGLQSFNLFVVPEPSLIALGALGLGALLLRRLRK